jgi:mono/diheme cytochrome c family protein
MIVDPNQLFAADDPTATALLAEYNNLKMPALGLTDAEAEAIIAYLGAASAAGGAAATVGQTQPAQPAPPAAALVGDPAAGLRAFTGETALANGGPSCIGCHSVSGLGGLGGGALGPDLTHAVQRYPGPALTSVLANIAFPTMIGPFANRPLTPQEQADLTAYLAQANGGPKVAPGETAAGAITRNTWLLVAAGVGGALVLLVLLAFFWPRQRQSVSRRLRNQRRVAVR